MYRVSPDWIEGGDLSVDSLTVTSNVTAYSGNFQGVYCNTITGDGGDLTTCSIGTLTCQTILGGSAALFIGSTAGPADIVYCIAPLSLRLICGANASAFLVDMTPGKLGFYGTAAISRPALAGSCAGNAGAYSTGQALIALGLATAGAGWAP